MALFRKYTPDCARTKFREHMKGLWKPLLETQQDVGCEMGNVEEASRYNRMSDDLSYSDDDDDDSGNSIVDRLSQISSLSEDAQISQVQEMFERTNVFSLDFERNVPVTGGGRIAGEIDLFVTAPKILFVIECKRSSNTDSLAKARTQLRNMIDILCPIYRGFRIIGLSYSFYGLELVKDVGPTHSLVKFHSILDRVQHKEIIRGMKFTRTNEFRNSILQSQSGIEESIEVEPIINESIPEGRADTATLMKLEKSGKASSGKVAVEALPPIARTSGPWAGMSVGADSIYTKAELLGLKSVRK